MNSPSICIPRVDNQTTKAEIYKRINKSSIGKIKRINFSPRKNGKTVFITFVEWYDQNIRVKLLNGECVYIGYFTCPDFWKCCALK